MVKSPLAVNIVVVTYVSGAEGPLEHTKMTGSHNSKVKNATEMRCTSAESYGGEAL